MKITIISASIIKNKALLNLINEYIKRFHYFKVEIKEFDDKRLSKDKINQKIKQLSKNYFTILLDEKGEMLNSIKFSQYINKHLSKNICLCIAGAEGFNDDMKHYADSIISLSELTFPHQMARLILIEQLYRAQSIILKHPYHKE